MTLQTGDIILSTKSNPFSFGIRHKTMSRFSHCRVMISPFNFVEATWPKVRIGSLSEVTEKFIVKRYKRDLTEAEKATMVHFLMSQVGRHYGWQSIINNLIGYRLFTASQPNCAIMTAQAFDRANLKLMNKDTWKMEPQDFEQTLELVEVWKWQ